MDDLLLPASDTDENWFQEDEEDETDDDSEDEVDENDDDNDLQIDENSSDNEELSLVNGELKVNGDEMMERRD